jgi:hypothetical protein
MFLTDCPVCGRRELRSPRVIGLTNTATGIEISYHCRGCGQAVTERLGALADVSEPAAA